MQLGGGEGTRDNPAHPAGSRVIRFGILGRGATLLAWQARCIDALLRLPYVRPSVFIVPTDEERASGRLRTPPRQAVLFNAYLKIGRPQAFTLVDMQHALDHVPILSEAEAIRGLNLDFILDFGSGVVDPDILDAARYGVWSFRFDDDQRYQATAPCFWEIYQGDIVNGAVLNRLTNREDAGIPLRRGYFRTALYSLRRNMDEVHFGAAGWPANVCADIHNGHTEYMEVPPSISDASAFPTPTNLEMVRFLGRQTRHAAGRAYRGLLRHEEWCIGIVDQPIASFLEADPLTDVRWLRPPGDGRFLADPFGVEFDGVVRILYEDFEYRTSLGVIATVAATATGPATPPEVALELPVTASYPYLFADRGEVYCIPETHAARQVALFRALDFPTRWEKVHTILRDTAALDSTVFRHEGRWWLLATDLDAGQYVHLFAWHAPGLGGPWEPHAGNPIKSDIRSARPAGTPFVHRGVLYRPAQNCSRTYGGGITLNRVLRLTPEEFAEEPAASIEPLPDGPFPDGLHTISAVGDMTLIDGKRNRFIPSAIPYVLRNPS